LTQYIIDSRINYNVLIQCAPKFEIVMFLFRRTYTDSIAIIRWVLL